MQLPIYHEIIIDKATDQAMHRSLNEAPLGHTPCYINLEAIPHEDLLTVMASIQSFLMNHKISWSYPYPIFILTPMRFNEVSIRQFLKKSEMPRYFSYKSKRPNPKEGQILQKNQLQIIKFKALYSDDKMKVLKELSPLNARLKLEAQKTDFYENLLSHLTESDEQ